MNRSLSPVIMVVVVLVITAWLVFLFTNKHQSTIQPTIGNIDYESGYQSDYHSNSATSPVDLSNESTLVQDTITQNTDRYQLEQLQIIDVKKLFQESTILGSADTSAVLEHLYTTTQDQKILKTLLEILVAEYRFDTAYSYLKDYKDSNYAIVEPHTALYILLNSDLIQVGQSKGKQDIKNHITYLYQFEQITESDRDFYLALLALYENNTDDFIALVQSLRDPKYAQFVADVQESAQMGQYANDLPPYYLRALLALDVMQYGYFKIAQQVAVGVLLENDGYDLPYQILAYSHFVMNNWQRAIEYLQVLLEQETLTYQENYKLLAGIANYRRGSYKQAILDLSQLSSQHPFYTDIIRYKIAAYEAMNDYKNMMQQYQQLLGQSSIGALDYYNFFEKVLFAPMVSGSGYVAAQLNEYLITQYTRTCLTQLDTQEHYVCDYGQAGFLLYKNQTEAAITLLEQLSVTIERSYVFAALGDYYHRDGQIKRAQEMYTKAVALAVDEGLKNSAQQKLVSLLQIQSLQ